MPNQSSTTQILTDVIDPARARALQVTLGLEPTIESGSAMPPFFHHVYFWDPQPPEALGRDGHPELGSFVPDMGPEFGTPRRMWAAGRLLFHGTLMAGAQAERVSVVEGVTHKS
ncbi:MAG: acyl dehydratase, partial [Octadecabacter sp.]